ncbi:MAG: C_GCAxxG_C_C family protein [Deltaproteobacteria bacterium]|nr:C_GCAxxG_C_C family protein [Deltaproteobacteria bacterium]
MIGKNREKIAERAGELAAEYEKTCTGCAQSVVAGLLDALEIDSPDVFKAASGLADGIGLTGDGSCGALTGCAMVIGLALGRERKDHRNMMKPMQSYLLCKELHDEFVREYGSCRCHDIQQRIMGRTFDLLDPKQLEEAFKQGMLEHCAGVCGEAARRTAELLLREQPPAPGPDAG